nr:hypothetical protein [Tanacetum cinerariifolium]
MDPDEFKAPQSLEQALPSPDYVHGLEYPEYVAPTDDEIPEESFMDDDDEEEASEKDEEEHLAPVESAALPTIDLVPSTKEAEPFQTDESASTPLPPRSPQTRVLFSQTGLRWAWKTIRPYPHMTASTKALIAEYASAPTPPSPPPSPLSPLSTSLPRIPSPPLPLPPLHTSPSYASAPLGYKAAMVQLKAASPLHIPSPSQHVPSPQLHVPSEPLLLPSVDRRSDIPKTDMPFQKRLCLTALAFRFEVWESSTADVARQIGDTLARRVDYEFIDTLDNSIRASEGRVMTVVGEVNERVTDIATTQRRDAHELYVRDEDAQEDRALLRAQISLLTRERGDTITLWLLLMSERLFMPDGRGLVKGIRARLWRLLSWHMRLVSRH